MKILPSHGQILRFWQFYSIGHSSILKQGISLARSPAIRWRCFAHAEFGVFRRFSKVSRRRFYSRPNRALWVQGGFWAPLNSGFNFVSIQWFRVGGGPGIFPEWWWRWNWGWVCGGGAGPGGWGPQLCCFGDWESLGNLDCSFGLVPLKI